MNIAILAWGSLIWCPGSLRIRTLWKTDGPLLPIEFARISQDDRLTLVIQPDCEDQPTYWAISEFRTLDQARDNLQLREKSKSTAIHHVLQDGTWASDALPEIVKRITEWVAQRRDVEGVVWTGLASNWKEKRDRDFSPEDAVNYLLGLEAERDRAKATYDRAREYVTNTPPGVDTVVRKAMRSRGWNDSSLSSVLFEAAYSPPNRESQ
jgi:hypothetical protein